MDGSIWQGPKRFVTTRWSLVLESQDGELSQRALSELCEVYWYPIYAFARRHGNDEEKAQDLAQAFFAKILESEFVSRAQRERGKFRVFLLTAFTRFMQKDHRDASRQKRGGGKVLQSLDWTHGENQFRIEPYHNETAEQFFDKQWALSLLDKVFHRLRSKYEKLGKVEIFEAFKVFLTGDCEMTSQRSVGQQLGLSATATKVTVHRLRERFRQLLRDEIAETVSDSAEVDAEMQSLFRIFSQ